MWALVILALVCSASAGVPTTTSEPATTTSEVTTSTTTGTPTTTTTTYAPPPSTPPHTYPPHPCDDDENDCYEEDFGTEQPTGACCFGKDSIGNVPEAYCSYAWAGPWSDASDCKTLHYCCHDDTCSAATCFECFEQHGVRVDSCKECADLPPSPTPSPPSTSTTKPPHTLPTAPQPTPDTPPTGCCCTLDGPVQLTAQQCYDCDGEYQGDGVSCDGAAQGICAPKCCDKVGAPCIACPQGHQHNETITFVGYGDDSCDVETCGVACCIGGAPVPADSSEQCQFHGGVPQPGVPIDEVVCGVGCCVGLEFSVQPSAERCTEVQGRYLGENVAYCPGICGGACCVHIEEPVMEEPDLRKRQIPQQDFACLILNATDCGELSGVYQGDDVPCGSIVPYDDDDDDDAEDGELDVCRNDGCCCLPDADGQSVKVANAAVCQKRGGVFLGEDTDCEENSCSGGVCCSESDFGGVLVANKAECKLKGGVYQGDGSRLDMPGICDPDGGACYCGKDKQCLVMPSATKCREYGCSFRGVGTRCTPNNVPENEQNDDDDASDEGVNEGSCCVPASAHDDEQICVIVDSYERCVHRSGVWGGAGSTCSDDTCKDVRGACCVRDDSAPVYHQGSSAYSCRDDLTVEQCRDCNGHWGGAESKCSDEYTCAPAHRGACCRDGHECETATSTACHRVGGRFQGFNTTCHDLGGKICRDCRPCDVDGPRCSATQPCDHPDAVCLHEYGLCVIPSTPIPTDVNYTLPPAHPHVAHAKEGVSVADLANKLKQIKAAQGLQKRGVTQPPQTTYPTTAETTSPHDGTKDNLGPLSCGDESTIGLPCIAKPVLGRGRIGVCVEPKEGSGLLGECESVCMHIREYAPGCECEGAWRQTCAAISGYVKLYEGHAGVSHVLVELYRFDEHGGYTFVSESKSGVGGHYAFASLPPGKYKVRVRLHDCYALYGEENYRIVKLTCLESASVDLLAISGGKAQLHSQLEHRANGAHLVEDVTFYVKEDCDEAEKQHNAEQNNGGDIGNAYGDSDDDDGATGGRRRGRHEHHGGLGAGTIVLIVISGLLLVGIVVCIVFASGNRGSRRSSSRYKKKMRK